jgi:hypothetical protein
MNDMIKDLISKTLRKIIFAAGSVWITKLLATGVVNEADINRWIEIATALLLIGGAALWTTISNWLASRKTNVAPTPTLPPVEQK